MIYEKRKIGPNDLRRFEVYLRQEERSAATLEKYIRDVRGFIEHIGSKELSKQSVLDYKAMLGSSYAVASANSMIAAINGFIRFCGWHDFCVKQFKVQRTIYCLDEKELSRAEYVRLLDAANRKKNRRLNLRIQTICATGIRVSELAYITVEAVQHGEAIVTCKGKNRRFYRAGTKKSCSVTCRSSRSRRERYSLRETGTR